LPIEFQRAALRSFVAAARDALEPVLRANDSLKFYNYGHETPYSDESTLRGALLEGERYWRPKNAFIADLIGSQAVLDPLDPLSVFSALTNYFLCYVAKTSDGVRTASTVRLLFPVDLYCVQGGQADHGGSSCQHCCFRYSYFPWKPDHMLNAKYDGHFLAAQYALADASFNAASPDLSASDGLVEIPIADLMVPLLFNRSVAFRDFGSEDHVEELRVTMPEGPVLVARRQFPEMNIDLGIRSEALIPVGVEKSFMPDPAQTEGGGWLPQFPASGAFCLEFCSPMPNWFATEIMLPVVGAQDKTSGAEAHCSYSILSGRGERTHPFGVGVPVPRLAQLLSRDVEELGPILALGFNMQHYGETMATAFVHWLRELLSASAFDPFASTLRNRFEASEEWRRMGRVQQQGAEHLIDWAQVHPEVLADVLSVSGHGELLTRVANQFGLSDAVDFSDLEAVQDLGRSVQQDQVGNLPFLRLLNCNQPRHDVVSDALDSANRTLAGSVLTHLAREIMRNHKSHAGTSNLLFHLCRDPYKHRLCLHFCSQGIGLPFARYLTLRQGQPQRYPIIRPRTSGHGGVGLALSRILSEENRLEYVVGLGRHGSGPKTIGFDVSLYRRDLHTRIYFGGWA
jgi:hypothetical protein